jgi:hypothetical protein
MAHFARVDKITKQVLHVHVVDNERLLDDEMNEVDAIGVAYLNEVHKNQPWINDIEFIQRSYNSNFRKNYPGIGFTFDSVRDAFIPIKPFNSWVLNEDTCRWEAPVPMPQSGGPYVWNEQTLSWQTV